MWLYWSHSTRPLLICCFTAAVGDQASENLSPDVPLVFRKCTRGPAVVHRRQIMSESVLVPGRPDLPRKQPLAHGRKLFLCSPTGPSRNICQSHSISFQRIATSK